jgi:hypothetical protein
MTTEQQEYYLGQKFGSENIRKVGDKLAIYDPETNTTKPIDPRGFKISDLPGDIAEAIPKGLVWTAKVPAFVGATLAAPTTLGTSMTAAALASGGAEIAREAIGSALSGMPQLKPSEVAYESLTSGIAPLIGKVIGKTIRPLIKGTGEMLGKIPAVKETTMKVAELGKKIIDIPLNPFKPKIQRFAEIAKETKNPIIMQKFDDILTANKEKDLFRINELTHIKDTMLKDFEMATKKKPKQFIDNMNEVWDLSLHNSSGDLSEIAYMKRLNELESKTPGVVNTYKTYLEPHNQNITDIYKNYRDIAEKTGIEDVTWLEKYTGPRIYKESKLNKLRRDIEPELAERLRSGKVSSDEFFTPEFQNRLMQLGDNEIIDDLVHNPIKNLVTYVDHFSNKVYLEKPIQEMSEVVKILHEGMTPLAKKYQMELGTSEAIRKFEREAPKILEQAPGIERVRLTERMIKANKLPKAITDAENFVKEVEATKLEKPVEQIRQHTQEYINSWLNSGIRRIPTPGEHTVNNVLRPIAEYWNNNIVPIFMDINPKFAEQITIREKTNLSRKINQKIAGAINSSFLGYKASTIMQQPFQLLPLPFFTNISSFRNGIKDSIKIIKAAKKFGSIEAAADAGITEAKLYLEMLKGTPFGVSRLAGERTNFMEQISDIMPEFEAGPIKKRIKGFIKGGYKGMELADKFNVITTLMTARRYALEKGKPNLILKYANDLGNLVQFNYSPLNKSDVATSVMAPMGIFSSFPMNFMYMLSKLRHGGIDGTKNWKHLLGYLGTASAVPMLASLSTGFDFKTVTPADTLASMPKRLTGIMRGEFYPGVQGAEPQRAVTSMIPAYSQAKRVGKGLGYYGETGDVAEALRRMLFQTRQQSEEYRRR